MNEPSHELSTEPAYEASEVNRWGLRLFLAGGLIAVVAGLMMDVRRVASLDRMVRRPPDHCKGEINAQSMISREQLAQFLTISERDTRARVQEILPAPYCKLPDLNIRAGVTSERAVYPLVFDAQTWLVVLYEGEEYAGYQFRVQR